MVLSLMRKHAKSWLIKFLIAIIALVFIFYFGYSFNQQRAVKIAYVNGEIITAVEYEKLYREMLAMVRQQYKDLLNDSLLKSMDLRNRALENLITQKLISQEARRLGLEITEEEIQQAIMRYPAFQINGRFDMRRYQALLANNRMNPEDFEEDMARGTSAGETETIHFCIHGRHGPGGEGRLHVRQPTGRFELCSF